MKIFAFFTILDNEPNLLRSYNSFTQQVRKLIEEDPTKFVKTDACLIEPLIPEDLRQFGTVLLEAVDFDLARLK